MTYQMLFRLEGLAAALIFTLIGSLLRVSASMDLEVVGGGELLATPTHGTLIRLLPGVDAFVFLEVTPCGELLVAVIKVTLKGVSRVQSLVGHQSELSCVALVTTIFIALVRSFSCVTSHMVLQLVGGQEGLSTVCMRAFVG